MKFTEVTDEVTEVLEQHYDDIEIVYDQGTLYPRMIYVHLGNVNISDAIQTINHAGIFNLSDPNDWRYRALRLLPHGITQ